MKKDLLQRLGGRKFLLTLLVVGIGTAIEIHTDRGVSMAFAGLLASLVAAFGAANYAVSKQYAPKNGVAPSGADPTAALRQIQSEMAQIKNELTAMQNSEDAKILVDRIVKMGDTLEVVGTTVSNTQKLLGAVISSRGGSNAGPNS